jgi:hypothetical protein
MLKKPLMTSERMQLIINIQTMCEKIGKVISFGFLEQLDAETLRHIQMAILPEYNVVVAGMKPEEVPLWGETRFTFDPSAPPRRSSFDYAELEARVAASAQSGEAMYTHDCTYCLFLGHYDGADLYYCPRCEGGTAVARYGNDGPDYVSMAIDPKIDVEKRSNKHLAEAIRRALKLKEKLNDT